MKCMTLTEQHDRQRVHKASAESMSTANDTQAKDDAEAKAAAEARAAAEAGLVSAIQNITAVGLATGIPNKASFPHILAHAFKNLLAVAVETSYDFPQAKQIKEVLKNPGAFKAAAAPAAAAPAAAGKAAAKAPEPEPEPEEEESAFSLFD